MAENTTKFKPFVAPETQMAELTIKSILTGAAFGIIFGASTVYLALKAGLTVSASIPIAVAGYYTWLQISEERPSRKPLQALAAPVKQYNRNLNKPDDEKYF